MELRNSRVQTALRPQAKVQQLLLRAETRAGPAPVDGGSAAMILFPDGRGRITPQWIQASLFDQAAARLLVGPSGTLLWASPHAEDLIGRTGCFRVEHDRLTGLTRRIQAKLDLLIADAGDAMVEDLFEAEDGEPPVLFVAARTTPGPKLGTVALVLREVGRESIQMPDLTRLFGLTHTENQIVGLLLNGLSVAEIAKRQGNSELTVRTHLKRSYSKMSIRTKEQLFAKLLRLMTD